MRKMILALAALLICVGAQAGSPLKWGVKAGLNYHTVGEPTSLGMKDIVEAKNRVGWHAGLQASWQVTRMLSIDPELVFSRNSYDLSSSLGGGGIAYLNTIEVPVILGVRIIGPLKVQAGVNINVMTDSGAKGEKPTFRFSSSPQALGYLLGVGVDLGHINVTARYNGFFRKNEGSIAFNNLQTTDDLLKMRVSTWQLGVGFYF
ncbi:MAG: PorT family protein [Rikenellaceae bacterium]|nr:PorT family protein [Rikenellaceae bacterium]MBR2419913.1 PorT family protein [Rikenellaceae bacterium]MBR2931163.1 PorT family protein [Rikenellaceae bacterium]MBR3800390.1 PorT family protein [Rikenellaceae bacterium]